MAPKHSPRFLQIVADAKRRIRETTVDEVKARLDRGQQFLLVDVREDSKWPKDHLPGSIQLGKCVIDRDLEQLVPDPSTELVLYCGSRIRRVPPSVTLQ